jgi:hypothetical protein
VTFGDFVEFIDAVRPEAEVLSLITPDVERQVQKSWRLSPRERTVRRLWGSGRRGRCTFQDARFSAQWEGVPPENQALGDSRRSIP